MNDFPSLPQFNPDWNDAMRIAWLNAWGQSCASYQGPRPIIIQNKAGVVVFDGWANVYENNYLCLHATEALADGQSLKAQARTIRVRVYEVPEVAP